VDDHPIVRAGLAELIGGQADMVVCGESNGGADLMPLVLATHPDVVVMDLSLGATGGLDLTRGLIEVAPRLRVLVMSMHDELLFAGRAMRAGARGYVMKQEAVREVLTAIRKVASGQTYVSARMAERIVAANAGHPFDAVPPSPLDRLTDRERGVFELIGRGITTRTIAERLGLSVKTIESHRAHLREKLGLETGLELVRMATTWVESL